MKRLFDSYLLVDWSAASKPTTGADSIWIGLLAPDERMKLKFRATNPSTRQEAETQIIGALDRLKKRRDRVFVGFDFSLGYPKGTAKALGLNGETPWSAMREFLAKELKEKPNNQNNRYPLAARMNRLISEGPFPFWGCPKRDELTTLSMKKPETYGADKLSEFRICETHAKTSGQGQPKSCWQLAYAGAVGSQTLTGIPALKRIQAVHSDVKVWPFETGWRGLLPTDDNDAFETPQILACEVYPSLVDVTPEKGEIKDHAQLRILSKYLADLDAKAQLNALFKPAEGYDRAAVEKEEGWILGVQ